MSFFHSHRFMPHANVGEDKEGHPIYWEETGLISGRIAEIRTHITDDDMVVRHVRQQEMMTTRLKAASRKYNKYIGKQVVVMNMENLSYAPDTTAYTVFRRTLDIDEAFYPERLKTLYMINAPWFFTAIWAIIYPWIDKKTAEKIKIVSYGCIETLEETIDSNQIPEEWGGGRKNFPWHFPHNFDSDVLSEILPPSEQDMTVSPTRKTLVEMLGEKDNVKK